MKNNSLLAGSSAARFSLSRTARWKRFMRQAYLAQRVACSNTLWPDVT